MKRFKYSCSIDTPLLYRWVLGCLLCGLFVNAAIYADQETESTSIIPLQCSSSCETKYGIVLGESPAGIPAYSNCNSECVIFEPHYLNDIYTGIKWQCVEYARRWLLHERGVVFGDVDIAADIWEMHEVNNPVTKQLFEFNSVVNGASSLPIRGDLLIYAKGYLGTGHVAVIVAIDDKKQTIQVVEQNYSNTQWQNKHAREIYYTTQNDRIWLLDSYLIGWKRAIITQH
jgi:hypothetical protein